MSLIFVGDIHQNWHHVEAGLAAMATPPRTAVLLGDIECAHPLDQLAAPLLERGVKVFWIHGNHDYDAGPEMWANLVSPTLNPVTSAGALHMRVVDIDGVRVAGLGGTFLPHVWRVNGPPRLQRRDQLLDDIAVHRSELTESQARGLATFLGDTAVFPEDIEVLSTMRADVLVTHEAPSSHPAGARAFDDLARAMGAKVIVHGHHHVTTHAEAADGLRALSVGDAWAVDLDGQVVWPGKKRERPLPRPGEGWTFRSTTA